MIAGLSAAQELTKRNLSVLVCEARDRVGGRVENGTLETSLDSLRTVVAKQDSTIQKLATATNVQIVK